jgi:hypothetical protein
VPAWVLPCQEDAAAGQHRRPGLAAHGDRHRGRVHGVRHDYADRHLAVVGSVLGVGAQGTRIEPDLAVHPLVKRGVEPRDVHVGCRCHDLRH